MLNALVSKIIEDKTPKRFHLWKEHTPITHGISFYIVKITVAVHLVVIV